MIELNAQSTPLEVMTNLEALIKEESVKSMSTHPYQVFAMIPRFMESPHYATAEEIKELQKRPTDVTFLGVDVYQDPYMAKDEIHLRDKDGKLVGKIIGLTIPEIFSEARQ
jgi:hypothetical protein